MRYSEPKTLLSKTWVKEMMDWWDSDKRPPLSQESITLMLV